MKSYRRAAVASTFSPTHLAVLTEADAFTRKVGAKLQVLHAAEKTEEKDEKFRQSFQSLQIRPDVRWLPTENPGDALIQAVRA